MTIRLPRFLGLLAGMLVVLTHSSCKTMVTRMGIDPGTPPSDKVTILAVGSFWTSSSGIADPELRPHFTKINRYVSEQIDDETRTLTREEKDTPPDHGQFHREGFSVHQIDGEDVVYPPPNPFNSISPTIELLPGKHTLKLGFPRLNQGGDSSKMQEATIEIDAESGDVWVIYAMSRRTTNHMYKDNQIDLRYRAEEISDYLAQPEESRRR